MKTTIPLLLTTCLCLMLCFTRFQQAEQSAELKRLPKPLTVKADTGVLWNIYTIKDAKGIEHYYTLINLKDTLTNYNHG